MVQRTSSLPFLKLEDEGTKHDKLRDKLGEISGMELSYF